MVANPKGMGERGLEKTQKWENQRKPPTYREQFHQGRFQKEGGNNLERKFF